ncbi:MAG: hypothetical protein CL670_12445 [Balneola sp.]|jgi:hypothetical protein|nr:hypothetical protein [Balneola sp.]MBE79957.1 hypothetical protein [Balneola sp.]|tara:strand:+ start:1488 stop:1724 length:237 start_codon:yes stop_codon:yes gene_type:complete
MAKRNTYHITKTKDGWKGSTENAKRASVTGDTKREVQEKTINIAKNKGNSSVVIHGRNGRIQEERTYPKGSDPYPPKG